MAEPAVTPGSGRGWKGRLLDALDLLTATASQRILGDPPGLLAFLFHGIRLTDDAEPVCDPAQLIDPAIFATFIGHFATHGYQFLRPSDLDSGLSRSGRYAMITFDDGYFNNTAALPVLEQFECPATFFIATGHIESGEAYWWDIVFRERSRQGASMSEIARERDSLKTLPFHAIKDEVLRRFGPAAVEPAGDQDRPMTPDELRAFGAHPLVHLGNHTVDHAILTACSLGEARDQVAGCQEALVRMVGEAPTMISYPNGGANQQLADVAESLGLRLGITTVPRRNRVRSDGRFRRPMLINRHMVAESTIGDALFIGLRAPVSVRGVLNAAPLRRR